MKKLACGKPVVLAASTHAGEEQLIARAIREAGGFPLIVPRHAERRYDVIKDLEDEGWRCILRTEGTISESLPEDSGCYIADTTGELRDWTALAQVAVIGKSFLAEGGQNPAEAVACGVPVVTGPHMENFAALIQLLTKVDGITQCESNRLAETLKNLLTHPEEASAKAHRALSALKVHSGATQRSVEMLTSLAPLCSF